MALFRNIHPSTILGLGVQFQSASDLLAVLEYSCLLHYAEQNWKVRFPTQCFVARQAAVPVIKDPSQVEHN